MSRFSLHKRNIEVAYGHDHACGWFVQVWDNSKEDVLLYSADQTNLTKDDCSPELIVKKAAEYGIIVETKHIQLAMTNHRPTPLQQRMISAMQKVRP